MSTTEFRFKGNVSTMDALHSQKSVEPGDIFYVKENGDMYAWVDPNYCRVADLTDDLTSAIDDQLLSIRMESSALEELLNTLNEDIEFIYRGAVPIEDFSIEKLHPHEFDVYTIRDSTATFAFFNGEWINLDDLVKLLRG